MLHALRTAGQCGADIALATGGRCGAATAQESGAAEVTLSLIEGAIEEGCAIMHGAMRAGGHPEGDVEDG